MFSGVNALEDQLRRSAAKPCFDGSHIVNFDLLEVLIDSICLKLDFGASVDAKHVVLTEPICTPMISRNSKTNECKIT